MEQILAIRPFVPSQDYAKSIAFYEALGFTSTHHDSNVTILKQDSFSFILQSYYQKDFAENCMVQVMVRNANSWWRDHVDADHLVAAFGVKPPIPPKMQDWGLKVGFLFDPSGVLMHIAEAPF